MLLSAVTVLVVAQSSSEIPEGHEYPCIKRAEMEEGKMKFNPKLREVCVLGKINFAYRAKCLHSIAISVPSVCIANDQRLFISSFTSI